MQSTQTHLIEHRLAAFCMQTVVSIFCYILFGFSPLIIISTIWSLIFILNCNLSLAQWAVLRTHFSATFVFLYCHLKLIDKPRTQCKNMKGTISILKFSSLHLQDSITKSIKENSTMPSLKRHGSTHKRHQFIMGKKTPLNQKTHNTHQSITCLANE